MITLAEGSRYVWFTHPGAVPGIVFSERTGRELADDDPVWEAIEEVFYRADSMSATTPAENHLISIFEPQRRLAL